MTKDEIRDRALALGFIDVGITTAEPFDRQREFLLARQEEYGWAEKSGLDLLGGTDPRSVLPGAKSIIVLVDSYFRESFPKSLESTFGRCYLDDDRVTRDGLSVRIKAFRQTLRDAGIDSKVPFNLPHRAAAARAGLGTLGRNCLFYSRKLKGSSWVIPLAVVVDREFAPDEPTVEYACPDWCRNACIAACPTRALKGNGTIDPRRCVSYLTYYGTDITPLELREPMGMYVYGCDRCQDVCPRNRAWLASELPENPRVKARAGSFDLRTLLAMDLDFFQKNVRPHMFYMGPDMLWKWKMNTARAMGNSLDEGYVPDLVKAYGENEDERVRSMIAWALGRTGGADAASMLRTWAAGAQGKVLGEIEQALAMIR
ncbi:MAG TPA: 4Fe-4S double cluster binding domain-containing protein [Deltaproteobacteria bacterium]|jgi:epoxyqueuosine reductase|nr:4Fe-4S double cluster binding domain-containing protein [Deltaproteobacteria bacterium]HOI07261.1 4Fe-4S double cluster binding domain-containing protein [Deltaproteobacteria bacterium]